MIVFGKLDENNIVLNVMVVDKKDTSDENGEVSESVGQAFCESITGWPAAQWVIEGYGNQNPCGVGMEWDPVNKIFWTHFNRKHLFSNCFIWKINQTY